MKRMDLREGARSPLSTNSEGGKMGFRRVAVGSNLITTCSELKEREEEDYTE